jgi:mRNA interferase MazF
VQSFITRGDIYYADLPDTFGSEQRSDTPRPVLIIQNNAGNKYSPTVIVATITSKQFKADVPTHVAIEGDKMPKKSIVLLEQIRTLDKKRLRNYITTLDNQNMQKINYAIQVALECKDTIYY